MLLATILRESGFDPIKLLNDKKYLTKEEILRLCDTKKLPNYFKERKSKVFNGTYYYSLFKIEKYLKIETTNPSLVELQKKLGFRVKHDLKTRCIAKILSKFNNTGIKNYKTPDITGTGIEVCRVDYAFPEIKLLVIFKNLTSRKQNINRNSIIILNEFNWYVHEIYTNYDNFRISDMIDQLEKIYNDQKIIHAEAKSAEELFELCSEELSDLGSFAKRYGLKMMNIEAYKEQKNPFQFELEDVLTNTLKIKKNSKMYKKIITKFIMEIEDNKENSEVSDDEVTFGSYHKNKVSQLYIEGKDYIVKNKKIMISDYLFGILAILTDDEKGKIIYDKLYNLKTKIIEFLEKRKKLKELKIKQINEVRLYRAFERAMREINK